MATLNLVLTALACLTSLTCMVLLFRGYAASAMPLLLWSALCFVCLSANNLLLFLDMVVFPEFDLRVFRVCASLAGIGFLLYAFLWEAE
jgi:hypothetical protein